MNIAEIESSLRELVEGPFDAKEFAYRFLEIYDAPKATVAKLRSAANDDLLSRGETLWKKKLFFRAADEGGVAVAIEAMTKVQFSKKDVPRFLLATDGVEAIARDTKTDRTVDLPFGRLNDAFDFFLPLAGVERYEDVQESQADIKAAGKLARLYDAILEANPNWANENRAHELNLFLTRVLFCFFAESTSIFDRGQFSSTVLSLTQEDGEDMADRLTLLFTVMNVPEQDRDHDLLPEYARKFRYVNGGLFRGEAIVPKFSRRARRAFKECAALDWRDINPDIFGSMIQAVVEPGMRGDLGMHYTSVPNIMKALRPLFLTSLEEELFDAEENVPKLQKLLRRLYTIRVFDPACGSGNFLIVAYRELRRIESAVFERLKKVTGQPPLFSSVRLSQFYGIELADFAAETAKLSLWISEYQMNETFKAEFGRAAPSLPLREGGNIRHGNACREDWLDVCPVQDGTETYVVGNPPYLGRADQTPEQKEDMSAVFARHGFAYKNLDYVACWYAKGVEACAKYGGQMALVTTNSICQGEQVALLWPLVYASGMEIGFAHRSFKWRNNAAKNAAVTCVVIGLRPIGKGPKTLYDEGNAIAVKNVSPYLVEGEDLFVTKRRAPISFDEKMDFGSMANDGGYLLLTPAERREMLEQDKNSSKFMRRLYGAQEFAKGIERWCLWIEDEELEEASAIAPIARRIDAVRQYRLASGRETTVALAEKPHRFGEVRRKVGEAILVPKNTSERRDYVTVGFVGADCVITDLAFAVFDAKPHIFAVLSSRLHYIWGAAVGGRFKSDPRYSNTLVYNTFPLPALSDAQKVELEECAWRIVAARENNPGMTIGDLYDPEKMPNDLRAAHAELDATLETIYIGRPFKNDTERLENLFKLYGAKIKKEKKGATNAR